MVCVHDCGVIVLWAGLWAWVVEIGSVVCGMRIC